MKLFTTHLSRGFIAVALDDPVLVIGPLKVQEGLAQLLHGGEGSHPEEVFLEDANEALGAAVAFRGPDKGWRALDTQEGEFILKIMGHILAAMIMPQGQAAIFFAVDHCSLECVGLHAAQRGTRFEALEPLRQGLRENLAPSHPRPPGPGPVA